MNPSQPDKYQRPHRAGGDGPNDKPATSRGRRITEVLTRGSIDPHADELDGPIIIPISEAVGKKLLTPSQVGVLVGLSRKSVMGMIQRGTLPALRDGGRYKVRLQDAERIAGKLPQADSLDEGCFTCQQKDSQLQALKEEVLLLASRLRKSDAATASARDQAQLLADSIRRECTKIAEIQGLVREILPPGSSPL